MFSCRPVTFISLAIFAITLTGCPAKRGGPTGSKTEIIKEESQKTEEKRSLHIKELLLALRNKNPQVREKAVAILRCTGEDAIGPLIDHGLTSEDEEICQETENAIAYIGGKAAWEACMEALHDPRPKVQVGAEHVLARLSGAHYAMCLAGEAKDTAQKALDAVKKSKSSSTDGPDILPPAKPPEKPAEKEKTAGLCIGSKFYHLK